MYVHTKIKAKPKKIYLTAMALLLMFGTVASPTSVVGLQVAQAKTSKKVSTKAASKGQTPRDGLQAIRDFNKKYASKKKPVFREDKANNSIANLGKDVDGYFTPNSKFKRNQVKYFGGGSGHWYKYMSGKTVASIRFVKDPKNLTSGSGSTGVVYPNVSIYHNVHERKMNTAPVTVRLTWMAGPKVWTQADMKSTPQKQLSFHTKGVSVSAQGEKSTDVFRVEYFLDTACKHPLRISASGKTNGDPTKNGSLVPKAAFTFKDIDYKQYIDMRKARSGKTVTPAFYDNGVKKKHQKTKIVPTNGSEYAKKGNLWTGGALGDKDRKKADNGEVDTGSIDTKDPRGWLTFIADDQHTYDFGHGIATTTGTNQAKSSAKTGALKNPAKLKNLPKSGYSTTFGNLWAFGVSKGDSGDQNLRWRGTATKYVSEAGIEGGKHKKPWLKNLTMIGTKKPIFYGIVTNAAWPANYHSGDTIYGIKDYGFVDNEIDPGLTIDSVNVYSQTAKGKPYTDKSDMFDRDYSNTTHKVKVTLKEKYCGKNGKYSAFFNHRWTVVIKATPNEQLPVNQKIHTKDGSDKLGAIITNVASWYTPGKKTTDTFRHGGSIGGSTVQFITTKPIYHEQPASGSAHKYVFRHKQDSKTAWADSLDDNYDGGTLYPGQEIKYQIRVHVPPDQRLLKHISAKFEDDPDGDIDIISGKSQSAGAPGGAMVVFDVIAKVKKNAKPIKIDKNGKKGPNIIKNSAHITLNIKKGKDIYDDKGNVIGIHWDPATQSMSTNTTQNTVIAPNIKAPTKTAYAVEDGKLYPLGQFEYNKKFKYVISQAVGYRNIDIAGDSFELSDDLPDSLKADDLTAKVYRLTKNNDNPADPGEDKTDASEAIEIDDDTKYGIDVTNSEGSLQKDDNKFTWVGDPDKMPFKGETYTMVITGTYKSGGDPLEDSDENGGYNFAVTNTAHSKIDGQPNDSNSVTVPVELIQPSLNKTIVAIHDDTTNQDITDFTQILKPQDNYTITYRFTSFAGNEFAGKKYHLIDDLPDNMKVVSIGKPQGSVMTEGGDGDYVDDDSAVANITTSGVGTDRLTINNSNVKAYGQYTIDVKASVKGQGDWSNYYDRMVYNNGSEGQKVRKATDASYMKIPNEANETYEDSSSVDAHNSSGIDFNMGVQTLKVKQFIAQDDSKWTNDLNPSHYLPVADGKADNSNKAVTTMLVIYAPNYLKNQKVYITTQADNSSYNDKSAFNSGGFERGAAALSLMDDADAIAYKNDASKLKFDNLNLKPAIDKANQTTSKTVDTQSLKTPGQTYTYERKYSPTTKFAKEFAKLKHLRSTFSSRLRFTDTTENNDEYFKGDNDKGINSVGIKLPNIYGYTTRMTKGIYSQDGKLVNITTYGEQVGLAVDNDHKTSFTAGNDKFNLPNSDADQTNVTKFDTASSDKSYTSSPKAERIGGYDETAEKQPVTIWVVPNGGNNLPQASGKYASADYGQMQTVKLKSNLGQGEKAKIGTDVVADNTRLKDLSAADFWPSKNPLKQDFSLIGFSSGSARTMTKGHSVVVATTDPQAKNREDTIAANRVTQLKYEPYVQHVFTAASTIERDKHKSVSDVKTDFVKPNTVATNPAQFITYYDSNPLPEKEPTGAKAAAQRVLREAYWLTAPKSMSAKASYGLEMPYQLHSFTYGKILDDKTLETRYQTNLQSKDAIFDAGNTKTANDERLGFSYDATQEVAKIKQTLNDNTLGNKTSLETLLDAISASNKLVSDDDAWYNILPDYNMIAISYRFNNRILDHGKQSFAKDNVMYNDYNKNLFGYTYGTDLVQGGFRNYLRDDLDLTNYPLNLYSSTANRGLINVPGFGVGYATSFDFTQDLDIYGTRMTTKNDHDAKDSDIIVEPALSGQNAQKHKDLKGKDNDWLKHNDAGSLAQDSSSSNILTR